MHRKGSEINKDHILRASNMFELAYNEVMKKVSQEKMSLFSELTQSLEPNARNMASQHAQNETVKMTFQP
jgi:hypothetical protein